MVHARLPPSYNKEPDRRYPVLYLHDGQNVFASASDDVAFGWGGWELDRTAFLLARAGRMQEVILVAIDNSPSRLEEYSGRHRAGGSETVSTRFENYEAFLIAELKPFIDHRYRTQPGASHTSVMGASLGGVCSMALAWDHPQLFGGAASLSGAFAPLFSDFLNCALKSYHGIPKPFRAYLDSGVVDAGGGDDGCSFTGQVASELRRIGWKAKDLRWFVDDRPLGRAELEGSGLPLSKRAEAEVSQHNEFYWRRRAGRALAFLFPPLKK